MKEKLRYDLLKNKIKEIHQEEVTAQYDPASERIFIDRRQLKDKQLTLRSLIHETIHREKGYSDSTPAFVNHLGDFAAKMVIKYDDLKESLK